METDTGCRVKFFQPLREEHPQIFMDTVGDKSVHAFLLLEEEGVKNAEVARAELTAALEKVRSNFTEEDEAWQHSVFGWHS